MSEFQKIVVGDETFEFPIDMSDEEIGKAIQSYQGSKSDIEPPTFEDFRGATSSRPAVIGSATKYMTKPFRELMDVAQERPVSQYLMKNPIAGDVLSATLGQAGDLGLLGLGALGTGVSGALSLPVEAYGLLGGASAGKKRQLARDVMGMMESMSPLGMGFMATRPATLQRKAFKPEERLVASEFEDVGIARPAATYGGIPKAISQTTEELPVLGERIAASRERASAGVGERLKQVVPEVSRETGGKSLISGSKQFIDETGAKAETLYDKFDKLVPPETRVETKNTLEYLTDAVEATKGLPAVENLIGETNKYRAVIKDLTGRKSDVDDATLDLIEDVFGTLDDLPKINDSRIRFETLKKLRTKIGQSMDDNSGPLARSLNRDARKALYAALSKDLEDAARNAGPEAFKAFRNANNYYKGRMKRIEDTFEKVIDIKDPEQAYKYIADTIRVGSPNESIRIIKSLQKSLNEDDFENVSNSIISRLGKKTDEVDEVFDTKLFLDQWAKINPSAKKVFAASSGKSGIYDELEKLARISRELEDADVIEAGRRLRTRQVASDVGRVTAGQILGAGAAAGGTYAAASSNPAAMALAATTLFATSRLMSNEKFLRAINSMAKNNFTPLEALAYSRDFGSTEARAILHSMNRLDENKAREQTNGKE